MPSEYFYSPVHEANVARGIVGMTLKSESHKSSEHGMFFTQQGEAVPMNFHLTQLHKISSLAPDTRYTVSW